jgi:hypothetical protein
MKKMIRIKVDIIYWPEGSTATEGTTFFIGKGLSWFAWAETFLSLRKHVKQLYKQIKE